MDAPVARRDHSSALADWSRWDSPIQDWRIEPARSIGTPFDTRLRKFTDAILVDARLSRGCVGVRREGAIGFVVVMFIADGRESGTIGAQRLYFERGDVVVWNSRQANLHFEIAQPLHKLMLFVAEERVRGLWPELISPSILHFSKGSNFSPFLAGYFGGFLGTLDTIEDPDASVAADAGVELVARAARAQIARRPVDKGSITVDAAIRYLETKLRDPEIDPDRVAAHFGISTRFLQILFARQGMTVSEWIRQRRLENCRKALQYKAPDETVTEIAFTWGFNDPSHFSRLFRQRFGMTPKAYARRYAIDTH